MADLSPKSLPLGPLDGSDLYHRRMNSRENLLTSKFSFNNHNSSAAQHFSVTPKHSG